MRTITLFLLVFITATSCYVEKRRYMSGFNISTIGGKKSKHVSKKNNHRVDKFKTELTSVDTFSLKPIKVKKYDKITLATNDSLTILDNGNNIENQSFPTTDAPCLKASLEKSAYKRLSNKNNASALKYKSFLSQKKKKKEKRSKSFSKDYFFYRTFVVALTSFLLISPATVLFLLSYLVGFLVAAHWYFKIKWKHPKLTDSLLFQIFYWLIVPQMFFYLGILILSAFGI